MYSAEWRCSGRKSQIDVYNNTHTRYDACDIQPRISMCARKRATHAGYTAPTPWQTWVLRSSTRYTSSRAQAVSGARPAVATGAIGQIGIRHEINLNVEVW